VAGSMSDVYEKRVLDLIFRNANASATIPLGLDTTNVWVGLYTATPSDAGGGTEVTGGSYARVAVARTGAGFNAATGAAATTANTGAITFPTATAGWGTVTQFGIFDAATAGNMVFWGDLTNSKTVGSGDTVSFAGGTITITAD
jgi:hypothetical protein